MMQSIFIEGTSSSTVISTLAVMGIEDRQILSITFIDGGYEIFYKDKVNPTAFIDKAESISNALFSVLPSKKPLNDITLPYESALYELIDKIAPGLDTGDLIADARTASKKFDVDQKELLEFIQGIANIGIGLIRSKANRILTKYGIMPVPLGK